MCGRARSRRGCSPTAAMSLVSSPQSLRKLGIGERSRVRSCGLTRSRPFALVHAAVLRTTTQVSDRFRGSFRSSKGIRNAIRPVGVATRLSLVRLRSDRSGATLTEYTLLVSLVMLALLALIIAVVGWASTMWVNFLSALNQ